jgi:hypothetical protein
VLLPNNYPEKTDTIRTNMGMINHLVTREGAYLVHIDRLESFTTSEDYGMVLIFRLSFSNIRWTRKFYAIYYL